MNINRLLQRSLGSCEGLINFWTIGAFIAVVFFATKQYHPDKAVFAQQQLVASFDLYQHCTWAEKKHLLVQSLQVQDLNDFLPLLQTKFKLRLAYGLAESFRILHKSANQKAKLDFQYYIDQILYLASRQAFLKYQGQVFGQLKVNSQGQVCIKIDQVPSGYRSLYCSNMVNPKFYSHLLRTIFIV